MVVYITLVEDVVYHVGSFIRCCRPLFYVLAFHLHYSQLRRGTYWGKCHPPPVENQNKLWNPVMSKTVIRSCGNMQFEEILGASEVGTRLKK